MIWNRCLLHRGAKTASKRNASATRRGTAKAVGNCSIALPVEEFILGNHLGLWTRMCHQAAYRITDFSDQAASFAARTDSQSPAGARGGQVHAPPLKSSLLSITVVGVCRPVLRLRVLPSAARRENVFLLAGIRPYFRLSTTGES